MLHKLYWINFSYNLTFSASNSGYTSCQYNTILNMHVCQLAEAKVKKKLKGSSKIECFRITFE